MRRDAWVSRTQRGWLRQPVLLSCNSERGTFANASEKQGTNTAAQRQRSHPPHPHKDTHRGADHQSPLPQITRPVHRHIPPFLAHGLPAAAVNKRRGERDGQLRKCLWANSTCNARLYTLMHVLTTAHA